MFLKDNNENKNSGADNINEVKSALYNFCNNAYLKSCEGPFGKIVKCIDKQFIKFLFVGFINTLFGYTMYAIFVTIQPSQFAALLMQYILGVFWNFKTTGALVFRNKDNSLIFKFFCAYIFTFAVNFVCLKALGAMGFGKYISQALLVLPVAILSFAIFKYFVFKKECTR